MGLGRWRLNGHKGLQVDPERVQVGPSSAVEPHDLPSAHREREVGPNLRPERAVPPSIALHRDRTHNRRAGVGERAVEAAQGDQVLVGEVKLDLVGSGSAGAGAAVFFRPDGAAFGVVLDLDGVDDGTVSDDELADGAVDAVVPTCTARAAPWTRCHVALHAL